MQAIDQTHQCCVPDWVMPKYVEARRDDTSKVKSLSTYMDRHPISLLSHLGKITETFEAQQIL